MLTVRIEPDPELECPMDNDGAWTLYSFNRRHKHFCDPDDLPCSKRGPAIRIVNDDEPVICDPGLRVKVRVGLAFVLSYFEHGNSLWMLRHGHQPAGVEYTWDGRRVAGLLVWNHDPSEMGAKSFEDRAKDAQGFLNEYNAWANGEGYSYSITDEAGDEISSCGGYTDTASMVSDIRSYTEGREVTLTGDCACVTSERELSKPEEVPV